MQSTNNGKKGGLLKGKPHYDKDGKPLGGIKAVVTDSGQQVELEGGEVIINKEASKKHWKELSRINQSAGGGVPIQPPSGADDDDGGEDFEKGGKIRFNPNKLPTKKVYNYAKKIKQKYPKVWAMGGNIYGNEAYKNLERALNRGYWLESEDWMFIKWQSFNARHSGDTLIAGIIANLKWLNVVDKGWEYMKNLIEAEIDKKYPSKMAKGGAISWNDFKKSQFDEEENRYLPSGYLGEFEIKNNTIQNYPILIEKINGLEYRKRSNSLILGVFDGDKQVADADNKVVQVAKEYQKRGIGVELIHILKQENPNHKFGSMTPEGWNLMGSYYDKKIANKQSSKMAKGGKTEILSPQGTLISKDKKSKLDYKKVGDNYEFSVFDGEANPVENYTRTQFKKRNGNSVVMSYQQFINFIYNEGFIDDKMAKGGVVTYKQKYNAKYDYPNDESHSLEEIAKDTGKSIKGLQQIYNKGIGAYKTNPESVRPNVKSKEQWAMARVYSAVIGGKASAIDANELRMAKGGKVLELIKESDAINNNGYFHYFKNTANYADFGQKVPNVKSFYLITYNAGGQKNLKVMDTINPIELSNELQKLLVCDKSVARILLNEFISKAKKIDTSNLPNLEGKSIIIADRSNIVYNNILLQKGGELAKGIKVEKEHIKTAKKLYNREITPIQSFEEIAKEHLKEDPNYYSKLKIAEQKFAFGGPLATGNFQIKTPTGVASKLSYIQQVLVRTSAFKKWFGDWQSAAKEFLKDQSPDNFYKQFKDISKNIDFATLEPQVVFHGTRSEDEFYVFDTYGNHGRPYGYFAYNREYSENFAKNFALRQGNTFQGLYEVFLKAKNPLMMQGSLFSNKFYDAKMWVFYLCLQIIGAKYPDEKADPTNNKNHADIVLDVVSKVGTYVEDVYYNLGNPFPFWRLMAYDLDGKFKAFLKSYGFDSIIYTEEINNKYDVNDPRTFTIATTIFDAEQVKLADGRNVNFDATNPDIRYKKGGELVSKKKNTNPTHHFSRLSSSILGKKYEDGGTIDEYEKTMKIEPTISNREMVDNLLKNIKK